MTAALVVGACALGSGDPDGRLVVEQADPAVAVTAPPVTAPPALRTVIPTSTTAQRPATATSSDTVGSTSTAADIEDPDGADISSGVDAAQGLTASPQTSAAPAADAVPSLADVRLELVPVADIEAPIALAARPGTGQRYLATLTGQVWLLDPAAGSEADRGVAPQLVADIGAQISQGCENGLLGIAFSPDGSQLYLSYTDTATNSRIAVMPMEGEIPQTERRRVLLALDQPACNHNGGDLAFGPDGNLWAGLGDGGGANDRFGHGQDRTTLLGTMVRIDPDPPSGRGYGIPAGNPFASGGGAPEVWAYGARNPWRFSFDRLTGDLWIGDVGQNRIEEIHVLPAADGWTPGANLGWPLFEGNERFSGDGSGGETPGDLVFPVYTYSHDDGCSVTGGYVYRGSAIAALAGTYVFGDYCTGDIWGLVRGPDGTAERIDLGVSVPRSTLVSFGEDANGELYVLSAAGTVLRLESAHP